MSLFKRKPKSFFTPQETARIVAAIKTAESHTSGEIKVHVEGQCEIHPFDRGLEVFDQLNMRQTRLRNGVLFYVAMTSRQFSIIADEGINRVVPADFWEHIKLGMGRYLATGKVVEGIVHGVLEAGSQLKAHFPYSPYDDENEISDDISLGE
jgi:uncharacterized membrane protein